MFQIEVMKKDAFSQFRERIEILLAAKARKPEAKLIAEAFGDPNNIICGGFDRGCLSVLVLAISVCILPESSFS